MNKARLGLLSSVVFTLCCSAAACGGGSGSPSPSSSSSSSGSTIGTGGSGGSGGLNVTGGGGMGAGGTGGTGTGGTGTGGMGTGGTGTGGAGGMDGGTMDSGTMDSGATDSGTMDSGSADSGTMDSGSADSGTTDSGSSDSGTTDSGEADTGTTDSGTMDAGGGCASANDCPPTGNACITATCVGGQCGTSFVAAGTPTSTQITGDCHQNRCDGVGNVTAAVDDTDLPPNNNPCTTAACNGGVPSNPPALAGTACGAGLVCNGTGMCVGCAAATDCSGTDTDCQTRTCTSGVCGFSYTAAGTPTSAQTPGDCHQNRCDGAGNVAAAVDDTDLPLSSNTCVGAVCAGGTPSNPPLPSGTACAQNGGTRCDGIGDCVECLAATDCPGTDTDCQKRTCTAGACGFSYATVGTPTSAQTPGDCHTSECDGVGNIVAVVDDTDVPSSSQCATGACNAGSPSSSPKASGTACTQNGGAACDGKGTCARAVVIVRSGDGGAALSSAATAAFLEERFIADGSLVPRGALNPLALPTAPSGNDARLTLSGTATSEGALALSTDGHYLTLAGYDAATGTAGVTTSASATVNRVVGRVDASFAVDTSTKIDALISGSNVRSAVTDNGSRFWVGGAASGVVAIPFGTTGGTAIISGTPTNVRVVDIFGGQLYASSGSGTFVNVFTIGSGLSTTAGQAATSLAGLPTSGASPYAFALFDLDAAIPGFDRLYVADDRGTPNGGIQRWSYSVATSQWVLSATLNQVTSGGAPAFMAFRGVTGFVSSGTTVTLIATATDATSANALVVFVDDGTTTPTGTKIAAAPTNTAFRGIALPPQ